MNAEVVKNKVSELFHKVNDNEEIFVVDVLTEETPDGKIISLLLDGDKGISINQCVEISRKMNEFLDEADVLGEKYTWEVSSPGADLPLKMYRQFPKHIGRSLAVKLTDGTNFEGKLKSVDGPTLIFEIETLPETTQENKKKKKVKPILVEKNILFEQVVSALVQISFK
jgi:ribosome maturation factor RimP